MHRDHSLKQRLAGGAKVFGCFLNACSPIVAEIFALAGYDCLMIDREHSASDMLNTLAMTTAIQTTACSVLVRVPGNDPVELKRILDLGVDGVMIPAVNDAAEARAAVAACRYPPAGTRGMAIAIARAADYGFAAEAYTANADAELLTICQIETRAAADNIEAIAAVEGIDMLFIGPYDLSANLGYLGQPDHPEAAKRIARIEQSIRASGKLLGGISTPSRSAAALYEAGYGLVLGGSDIAMIRELAGGHVAANRPVAAGAAARRGVARTSGQA